MYKRRRTSSKKILYTLLAIVLVVAAVVLYAHAHNKSANLAAKAGTQAVKGTVSTPTPHQVPSPNSTGQSGGVVDKNGQASTNLPPASQWVSSSSGNITLQQPSPNTVVTSGDSLVGLAKVSTVQFILKDDAVGQIAQGNLTVVNGRFSGVLQFTPHSKSGKLEIYYPNPNNGAEEDIVEINVGFNVQ